MTANLGEGKLIPLLVKFSIPAIAAYFISELYNMVDSYFVGNAVGALAIASLGIVFPIQRFLIAFSLLFSFASSNLLANFLGAKNKEASSSIIPSTIYLNFVFVIPFVFFIYFFKEEILHSLSADGDVFIYANEYLSIVIWGAIFLTLGTCLARILLVFSRPVLAIVATASPAIINIIFDFILVDHFAMAVLGAAYATLISQVLSFVVSSLILLIILRKEKVSLSWKFRLVLLYKLFTTGLPSFIVESEDAIVLAILNFIFFKVAGEEGIAILSLNIKCYMMMFVLVLGLAYGMQTIIAYNFGARNFSRVKRCLKISLLFNLFISSLMTLLFYIFAYDLLNIFVNDENILTKAVCSFRIMILCFPFLAIYYSLITYLQASMHELKSIFLSFCRQLVFLCPMMSVAYFLFDFHFIDLFYIYPLTDILASLIAAITFYFIFRKLDKRITDNSKLT